MEPSFDLRLRSMIKAVSEKILPAMDPAAKSAIEQAHILIGSLHLLRDQIDYAHWYEVVDIKANAALLERLAMVIDRHLLGAAQAAAAAAAAMAERHDVTLSTLHESGRGLREAICAVIDTVMASADPEVQRRLSEIILEHSKRQNDRQRAFVAGTKFDVFPESLQTIEAALTATS